LRRGRKEHRGCKNAHAEHGKYDDLVSHRAIINLSRYDAFDSRGKCGVAREVVGLCEAARRKVRTCDERWQDAAVGRSKPRPYTGTSSN
jgi:hypothetical protein